MPAPALASSVGKAPLWRREPYRVLFPLGVLLAWAGVLHWLLFALGVSEEYRAIFHSMAQIQGFIACYAVGFSIHDDPRRTGTTAPASWQMVVAIVAPVATTACAWFERWAFAQAFWLLLLAVVMTFALRRFRPDDIPDRFVWVVAALSFGIAGAILAGYGAAQRRCGCIDVGRGLVLQGNDDGAGDRRGRVPPSGDHARRGAAATSFFDARSSIWPLSCSSRPVSSSNGNR